MRPAVWLKLKWRLRLDRPMDTKMKPPSEVVAASLIPPIVESEDEVTFLRPDGGVLSRIPLADDRNLFKRAYTSPTAQVVVVTSEFSAELSKRILGPDIENAEGGEFHRTFTVYDRSAHRLYQTTGMNDDELTLTDSGHLLLQNFHSGEIQFFDRSTGASVATTQFPAPMGGGPPMVAISDDGQRVFAGANVVSVGGSRDPRVVHRNTKRFLEKGVREAWVGMYDGAGRPLWRKQLAGATAIEGVGISGDGRYAIVSAERHAPGPLEQRVVESSPVFILDGDGGVIASGGSLARMGDGPFRFDEDLQAFVEGGNSMFYSIAYLAGHKISVDPRKSLPADLAQMEVRDGQLRATVQAILGLVKHRIVLLILGLDGRLLVRKTIKAGRATAAGEDDDRDGEEREPDEDRDDREGEPDVPSGKKAEPKLGVSLSRDGRFVTVRVDQELRVYEIRARGRGERR